MRKTVLSRSGDRRGGGVATMEFEIGSGREFVTDEGDSESRG